MLEVPDHALVVVDLGKHFATLDETLAGDAVGIEGVVQPAHGTGSLLAVGGEPNVGHASAINQFL